MILVLLFFSFCSFSQEVPKKSFHTIGVTGGLGVIPPILWGQVNYGVEVVLLRRHTSSIPVTLLFHAKRIHMIAWGLDMVGNYGGLGVFTGKKKGHLEFNLGVGYFENRYDPEDLGINYAILPTGYLGFRLQAPESWISFRVGVGFPEVFSTGLGIHF